ncbi:MAG: tetratricopeptide repeat protein [Paracoccaceae bacterium]|nr:tetratricopeptide repeat protein [Paracoccaceae bacterium]MDE3121024.1 tetratricopeptide repeat protein [Paracoccaceae bacterium]MDE3237841.1 tetratricopeptide repeat protein [Paracoccaceae bacterium]
MRHPGMLSLCLLGAVLLSGCAQDQAKIKAEVAKISAKDEASLDAIELNVADPTEAVAYFRKSVANHPERTASKRYLAMSLVRAKQPVEAVKVWQEVVKASDSTMDDRVNYADALLRAGKWAEAGKVLSAIPPTHETYDRYRLEAMIADSKREWRKADSFYETAAGMTTTPAPIYNNWGFSKLSRHDYAGAERLFRTALQYDPTMYVAKNNLVIARGMQRKYDLPVIQMTQTERAHLLYTLALTAIKQDDIATGKALLEQAIATNPEYFEAAQRSLDALTANVSH